MVPSFKSTVKCVYIRCCLCRCMYVAFGMCMWACLYIHVFVSVCVCVYVCVHVCVHVIVCMNVFVEWDILWC